MEGIMELIYNMRGTAYLKIRNSLSIIQPFNKTIKANKYDNAINLLYVELYDRFLQIFPNTVNLTIDIEGYEVKK